MTTTIKRGTFASLALVASLAAGACGANTHHAHLTAKNATTGVLTGRLIMLGGTSHTGQPRPIAGTISFIQHGRVVATTDAAADGAFSRSLTPGRYQVRACTATIQLVTPNGSHVDTCAGPVSATVTPSHTTVVDIPDFIVP
jgi:hypothetical protein